VAHANVHERLGRSVAARGSEGSLETPVGLRTGTKCHLAKGVAAWAEVSYNLRSVLLYGMYIIGAAG